MRNALALSALLAVAAAAEEPPHIYLNRDLGIRFAGIFGWDIEKGDAGGTWNLLARYDRAEYDGAMLLQTRSNAFTSFETFRESIRAEFPVAPEGTEPQPNKPVLKEVTYADVAMKGGMNLSGVQVDAVSLQITKEGKKREQRLQVRTYYGKNRLFRVACSVSRARHAKVKDLFDRAIDSLEISAVDEAAVVGTPFRSNTGGYACLVPEGFGVNVGGSAALDAWFDNRRLGVTISMVSYAFPGELRDHLDRVAEHYGTALTIEKEETPMFGETGFTARVAKDGKLTRIAGVVHRERAIRVHVEGAEAKAADIARILDDFVKGVKLS